MRIGLYGLPCAGKSYILEKIDFMPVLAGSQLLHQIAPDFSSRTESERNQARMQLATQLMNHPHFIMDGHYAFGDEVVFTPEDGRLYDAIVYLWISPEVLRHRMNNSEKNRRYLKYDIARWQQSEVDGLRAYCHCHSKDFYVMDHPNDNVFSDVTQIIAFLRAVQDGFSCHAFAQRCAAEILENSPSDTITLLDGDRTLTLVDSSKAVLHYATNLFDGNFYTGYQSWCQAQTFPNADEVAIDLIDVPLNQNLLDSLAGTQYILTTGHPRIWEVLASRLSIPCFSGVQMSAETKLFITQELQRHGRKVVAYGDSMNDYYMLRQADEGYLVKHLDGTVSRSLRGQSLEGITLV